MSHSDIFEAFALALRWCAYIESAFVFAVYYSLGVAELRKLSNPRSIDEDRANLQARIDALGTPSDYYARVNVAALMLGMGLIVTGFMIEGAEALWRFGYAWWVGREYDSANSYVVRIVRNSCFMTGLWIKLIPWLQGRWGRGAPAIWVGFMAVCAVVLTGVILSQGTV